MKMNFRPIAKSSILPAMILLVFLLPSRAPANVPVPSMFGMGAPFFLTIESIGLLFMAIVLIEASVLRFGLRIGWKDAIRAAALANLGSSLLGVFLSGVPAAMLLLFFLPVLLAGFLRRKMGLSNPQAYSLALAPTICIFAWCFLSYSHGMEMWSLYVSLLPAFVLTVLIELPILRRFLDAKRLFGWTVLSNTITYLALAVYMWTLSYSPLDNPVLTIDYFYTMSMEYARSGKVEESLRRLDWMREFIERHYEEDEGDAMYLRWELKAAIILAENGHAKEAAQIMERVKQTKRAPSPWDQEIESQISKIERMSPNRSRADEP
ncbi:hypothetical protein JXA32_06535 [Candidatus Sumerlaeota bacterium]|nr:hypothetical protein [Candidatus Sumerlaeota bacterium]